jgi:hypothetical protein
VDEGRGFTIIDYEDRYKQALEDISLPWLLEYDLLEPVDLEMLEENNLIHTDMKHLALLTLYADYQVLPAKERARDIYLYFSSSAFTKLHLEEMFLSVVSTILF